MATSDKKTVKISDTTNSSAIELSDHSYNEFAMNIVYDYARDIEKNGVARAVHQYCIASLSFGKIVDEERLLKTVRKILVDQEKEVLGESRRLCHQQRYSTSIDESTIKIPDYAYGSYKQKEKKKFLIDSNQSPSKIVEACTKEFDIEYSTIRPSYIKTRYLSEGNQKKTTLHIPVCGKVNKIDPQTERTLDLFVESWNKLNRNVGEPVQIEWSICGDTIYFESNLDALNY